MRRLVILAVAAIVVAASVTPAQAAGRRSGYYGGQRQGVFSRLMELERRKNAWLFGR